MIDVGACIRKLTSICLMLVMSVGTSSLDLSRDRNKKAKVHAC